MGIGDPRQELPGAQHGPAPRKPAGNSSGRSELCSSRHSAVPVGAACGAPRSRRDAPHPQASTPVLRAQRCSACPGGAPRFQAGVRHGAKSGTQAQSCTQRSERGFPHRPVPGGAPGSLVLRAETLRPIGADGAPRWSRGSRGRSALPVSPQGGSRTAPGGAAPRTRVGSAAQSTTRDRGVAPCGD